MALTLLAILIAALAALAVIAASLPRIVVTLGSACIAGLMILLTLAAIAGLDTEATLTLPFGPPGTAMHLALDPLGEAFLLLILIGAKASALFADADAPQPALPMSIAALALTLLAADAFTLALGLLLLALATRSSPRTATFSIVCLIAAFALATPASTPWLDADFAAIRSTPPEAWRATAVLLLVLLAASAQAIQPTRGTLPAVTTTTISVYLLIRVLLDLCGPSQPLWWSIPLLILGAIAAPTGALRAVLETTLQSVISRGGLHQLGLATIAVGIALLARAVDLPDVALLALDATWLLLAAHVLCRTLLLLCADAVETGAGTRRLDRLGGIIHGMPITAICTLAGLLGIAILPPGLSFAGFWLLFQALLAAARIGGFALQLVIASVTALAALSAGLSVMAAVRLFGVAFLGRPRTPRTAAAEEPPRLPRAALIGMATLTALLALVPAIALLPASAALTHLANSGSDATTLTLTLRPGADAPGYAPLAITALLTIAGCAVFWLLLRNRTQQHRPEPAWSGGFAPPPAWLPFGDPATQYGPASFAEPLQRIVGKKKLFPLPLWAWAAKRTEVGGGDSAHSKHGPGNPAPNPLPQGERKHRTFRRAIQTLATPDTPTSIATTLIVISLAIAAWLAAP
jgi:hydrogenase-4 component B